ncbi:PAS domain S-box protein, partial [Candidatus Bathyarchaeota archaeon]|nr:PAS domain S-box protein [Candidatus Bathyarchaeota archaeon]
SLLNRKGCEVLGYTEKEALGKSWFDTFLPARTRNQVKAEFKSLIAGKIKDIEYYETSVLTRNGEERLIAWNNTVLRDYEGRVLGTLSSGNDITERKQFEEELKKERDTAQKYLASLESIFVSSPNAITVTDLNGNIVECNPEALKISGFTSKDELISKNAFELIAVKDRKQALENLRKTLEYDSVKNVEYILLTKDGREYPAEFSVSVIKDSKGKPTGFVAVIQDIADRKKVEEEIRIKDSAIASSINAIAFADLEGNITYVNSSFLELWGYEDEKEVIGEPSVKFWQMDKKASEIVEVLRDKGKWMGELIAKRKDGSSFDVQISANTVKDETGKSICMMASFIDITKRKEMEEIKTNSAYISHGIKPGESYISDSHEKAYKAYADLVMHGVSGLCFLRENPTEFTQKYKIDREKIYILSSRHVKDFKHIDDIQEISLSLGKFLKNNGKSIVLLSGLEYLISRFGFPTIFKFIQEKRLDAFEVNSTILFPVHIEALDKKEAALLNSELKTLR